MGHISFEGRIAKDIDLRNSAGGKPYVTITTTEKHDKKNQSTGEYETTGTTWRDLKAFGDDAEDLASRFRKGDIVKVYGEERTREYETKDGRKGTALEVFEPLVKLKKRFEDNGPRNTGGFGGRQSGGFGQPAGFNQAPGYGAPTPAAWEQDADAPF